MAIKNKYVLEFSSKGVKVTKEKIDKLDKSQGILAKNSKKLKAGMAIAGTAIIAMGTYAIKTAGEFERLQTRLTTMYGSVNKGTKAFQQFVKIASTTPYAVKSVVEAGASLKAFGMDAEKNIKGVADLAAFMGVDIVEAANAMGRAFAGGAGAADVLRERGVLELIKSFKGIEDITKLTLPEFRTALIDAMEDPSMGISGSTTALAETFEGNMSNMLDAVDMLAAGFGEKLLPIMKDAAKFMKGWAETLGGAKDPLEEGIITLRKQNSEMGILVRQLEDSTKGSGLYQQALNRIKKEYPELLTGMDGENIELGKIKENLIDANFERQKEIGLLNQRLKLAAAEKQLQNIYENQYALVGEVATQQTEMYVALKQRIDEYAATGGDAATHKFMTIQLGYIEQLNTQFNTLQIGPEKYGRVLEGLTGNIERIFKSAPDTTWLDILTTKSNDFIDNLGKSIYPEWYNDFSEDLLVPMIGGYEGMHFAIKANIKDMQDALTQYEANKTFNQANADAMQVIIDNEIEKLNELELKYGKVEGAKKSATGTGTEGGEGEGEGDIGVVPLGTTLPTIAIPIGLESTQAELDAAMIAIKEKLTEDLLVMREELAELNIMDTIAGGTSEEREEKKLAILNDINEINQAINTITTETATSTSESLSFLGRFAKGFKKTVVAIGADENQVVQDVLDGASALIAAGGQGKENQIKMQKAMIKANVAKGLIDIWTSPAPSDPLTAAKAIAASAVLIGKASQSNQQLNQALADLKGGSTETKTTFAEYGMNEVVDGATPIIAGEAGAELVQITPLEGPNANGPQGQGQIVITGNVLSKDFVEDELVEQLKESIRQGYDFR